MLGARSLAQRGRDRSCPWHGGSREHCPAFGVLCTRGVSTGLLSSSRLSSSLPADPARREPGSALTPSQKASAVPVLPHEGHDAGRGPSQLEEGVSQQLLCCGSLRGLPHQHRVQEAPEDRGDLKHHTGIRGGKNTPFQLCWLCACCFLGKKRDILLLPTVTAVLSRRAVGLC